MWCLLVLGLFLISNLAFIGAQSIRCTCSLKLILQQGYKNLSEGSIQIRKCNGFKINEHNEMVMDGCSDIAISHKGENKSILKKDFARQVPRADVEGSYEEGSITVDVPDVKELGYGNYMCLVTYINMSSLAHQLKSVMLVIGPANLGLLSSFPEGFCCNIRMPEVDNRPVANGGIPPEKIDMQSCEDLPSLRFEDKPQPGHGHHTDQLQKFGCGSMERNCTCRQNKTTNTYDQTIHDSPEPECSKNGNSNYVTTVAFIGVCCVAFCFWIVVKIVVHKVCNSGAKYRSEYRPVGNISTGKTYVVEMDGKGSEGDNGCGNGHGRSENTDIVTSDTDDKSSDADGRAASAAVVMRDHTWSGRVKAKPATVQAEGESDHLISI